MADQITLILSHNELAFLLFTLKLPPMVGMAYFPEDTSEETANALIQAGAMALDARGFVRRENETLRIDNVVLGVLGGYAMAQKAVTLLQTIDDQPSLRSYYLSPDVIVEHAPDETGIHQLTVMVDKESLIQTILSNLKISSGYATTPQPIPDEILQQVFELVEQNQMQSAIEQLTASGWKVDFAEQVVTILSKRQSVSVVGILEGQPLNGAASFTLMSAVYGTLLIKQAGSLTEVSLANAKTIQDYLRSHI